LLDLESKRFEKNKEKAWKCGETLTPHGIKKWDEIFATVNYHYYTIATVDADDRYICTVSKNTYQDRKCYFFKEMNMGSVLVDVLVVLYLQMGFLVIIW
jgi:hypothetical protein